MQTAAASVRNAAAQRAKEKGAALPGQAAAAKKAIPSASPAKKANVPAKAPAVTPAAVTKKNLAKLNAVNGSTRPPSIVSTPKKPSPGSKPIGTQKYENGMKA